MREELYSFNDQELLPFSKKGNERWVYGLYGLKLFNFHKGVQLWDTLEICFQTPGSTIPQGWFHSLEIDSISMYEWSKGLLCKLSYLNYWKDWMPMIEIITSINVYGWKLDMLVCYVEELNV